MINIENIKVDVAGRGHITNSDIIYDDVEKEAVLIDPGYEYEKIIKTNVKTSDKTRFILFISFRTFLQETPQVSQRILSGLLRQGVVPTKYNTAVSSWNNQALKP